MNYPTCRWGPAMSGGVQGRRAQSQLQGWQQLKCTEVMGFSLPSSQPQSKDGAFYLVGCGGFWESGSFVSEVVGLRSQVRTGYFWRKVQLFLDQQPLVVGHQVRWRQQLQQVPTEALPPEGWCCHAPQQVRGASCFWKQVRLASPLIKVALWVSVGPYQQHPTTSAQEVPIQGQKGVSTALSLVPLAAGLK